MRFLRASLQGLRPESDAGVLAVRRGARGERNAAGSCVRAADHPSEVMMNRGFISKLL
jgi:hypothetical protein